MAEQSKFSGALAKLNQRPVIQEPATQEPIVQESMNTAANLQYKSAPAAVGTSERPRIGRPTGKRSDPDFQQTTLLLRKETKKKAARQLEDSEAKMDLSELVEQLLTDWTARQV